MKKIFTLLTFIALLSGCTVVPVNTMSKIPPQKPYSRILTVYVKGAFDMFHFNADAYNLFIKTYFQEPGNKKERSQVEGFIHSNLPSYITVVKSSDIEGIEKMNYKEFRKLVDSMAIDAILLVDLRQYTYNTYYDRSGGKTKIPDAAFQYYLIVPGNGQPVWIAQSEIKNKSVYNGKAALKRKMAAALAKSLIQEGYINAK